MSTGGGGGGGDQPDVHWPICLWEFGISVFVTFSAIYVVTSQLWEVEETALLGKNHRELSLGNFLTCHGRDPNRAMQWWETVTCSCQWQPLDHTAIRAGPCIWGVCTWPDYWQNCSSTIVLFLKHEELGKVTQQEQLLIIYFSNYCDGPHVCPCVSDHVYAPDANGS